MANVPKLCHTKSIMAVNGQFPGPKIVAREGDRVVVEVLNHGQHNVTLHWYVIMQSFLSTQLLELNMSSQRLRILQAWGSATAQWMGRWAGVTQCPIQTARSYVYNFTIDGQRGTLWWHAHISWLRSTLYGPIIILPKLGVPCPFAKPYKEVPLFFGMSHLFNHLL